MENVRRVDARKASNRVCETCRWYHPIFDICLDCRNVRSEEIRRKGCPLWEREEGK